MSKSSNLLSILEISFNNRKSSSALLNSLFNDKSLAKNKGITVKVINMSPDEYIDIAVMDAESKGFTRKQLLSSRETNKSNLDKISKIKNIDMPHLSYIEDWLDQEGLHRAIVAKREGIDNIPVLIAYKKKPKLFNGIQGL